MRTQVESDAWADGQVRSKLWLCEALEGHLAPRSRVWLLGGWYAMTAFLLFSRRRVAGLDVTSFDLDPDCAPVACRVNNTWEIEGRFRAITADVTAPEFSFEHRWEPPDAVVNTSCEHMDPSWFGRVPPGTLVAVQGTDMDHEQHGHAIGCLAHMRDLFPMRETLFAGSLPFSYPDKSFLRFMVIGRR